VYTTRYHVHLYSLQKGVGEVEALDTAARASTRAARRLKAQLDASEAAAAKARTATTAAVSAALTALTSAKDKLSFVQAKAAAEVSYAANGFTCDSYTVLENVCSYVRPLRTLTVTTEYSYCTTTVACMILLSR
jgi:hypothetical protein